MVVEVSNNVPSPIAVPVVRIAVPEEHDAGTNLEPEHVGWKARRIEVVNEFEKIYILLINTVAALVDYLISRKFIHQGLFSISVASLVGVMMALPATHSFSGGYQGYERQSRRGQRTLKIVGSIPLAAALCAARCP